VPNWSWSDVWPGRVAVTVVMPAAKAAALLDAAAAAGRKVAPSVVLMDHFMLAREDVTSLIRTLRPEAEAQGSSHQESEACASAPDGSSMCASDDSSNRTLGAKPEAQGSSHNKPPEPAPLEPAPATPKRRERRRPEAPVKPRSKPRSRPVAKPVKPAAKPPAEELVYSQAQQLTAKEVQAASVKSMQRRKRFKKAGKTEVTEADRELADKAIRDGTVKVTKCAPGPALGMVPKWLENL